MSAPSPRPDPRARRPLTNWDSLGLALAEVIGRLLTDTLEIDFPRWRARLSRARAHLAGILAAARAYVDRWLRDDELPEGWEDMP